jgi:hypothetical protein
MGITVGLMTSNIATLMKGKIAQTFSNSLLISIKKFVFNLASNDIEINTNRALLEKT